MRKFRVPRLSALSNRKYSIAMILLIISIFGPYLIGPIRTEHVAIYGFLIFIAAHGVWKLIRGRQILNHISSHFLTFPPYFFAWLAIVVVSSLSSVFRFDENAIISFHAAAALDSLVLPLAAFMVALKIFRHLNPASARETLTLSLSICLAINTGFALLQGLGVGGGLWGIFHQNRSRGGLSTFDRNEERFTGVFNQPIEAGVAYSAAAILVWIFMNHRPRLQILLFTLIALGGFLAVSKVFLFGGLGLSVAVAFSAGGLKKATTAVVAAVGALLVALPFPKTLDVFGRLVTSITGSADEDFLYVVTAGRTYALEPESSSTGLSPWFGEGLIGLVKSELAVDTASSHVFALGGYLGLFAWVATLAGITLQAYRCSPGSMRLFQIALIVLILGASLGFEPLSSNRSGQILWILLAFVWSTLNPEGRESRSTNLRA